MSSDPATLEKWQIPSIKICKHYIKRLCGIDNYCNHSCNETHHCDDRSCPIDGPRCD